MSPEHISMGSRSGPADGLQPDDRAGTLIVAGFIMVTTLGLWLSWQGNWLLWCLGQLLLGVSFLQWSVALHEAGHGVLFRSRMANQVAGHLAGFITLIPFHAWQPIHQKHHIWTGWQDRDPTTMALVPRRLGRAERFIINGCWRTGVPLFSLLYRVNNFWNVPRLLRLLPQPRVRQRIVFNTLCLVAMWLVVAMIIGPAALVHTLGAAMVLGFMLQEPIILSQHTHIPMHLAGTQDVAPFAYADQVPFTRSLRFPMWISKWVLLHFDAHELHHEQPHVPGWRLRSIDRPTPNDVPAWQWIWAARAVPAEVFLFSNRNSSGLDV